MKKKAKVLLVTMLSLVMMISALSGCSSKPKAEDAEAYVKAVMDIICTGDYDHSVKLADVEEGSEAEIRDSLVKELLAQLSANANFSEETSQRFADFMLDALSKCRYTITGSTPVDDGYDVTVSIEPLKLFAVLGTDYEARLTEQIAADAEKVMAMSEQEQTDYVMGLLLDMLEEGLADPQYAEAEEVTVHYGIIDDEGHYGCGEDEGRRLGEKLFSDEGL